MKLKNIFLILLSTVLFSGCASGPLSTQVDESEINAEAEKAYAEIKTKAKFSQNKEWNAMVQRVAQRIAKASGKDYQWEAILVESPEVNAWCMPGGKIAVYTGIMPVLKTEGALAAVMGHEVAHATLKHGMTRYARAKQNNYIGLIVAGASMVGGELLCKTEQCKQLTQLGGVAAGFTMMFLDRKFSREDESSADKEGQIYMARAGYDPSESLKLWERMNASKQGNEPPEFVSTHPSDATRRNNLTRWLPQAESEYAQAPQKYGLGANIK
jgi:predicted Zn-dependent protease